MISNDDDYNFTIRRLVIFFNNISPNSCTIRTPPIYNITPPIYTITPPIYTITPPIYTIRTPPIYTITPNRRNHHFSYLPSIHRHQDINEEELFAQPLMYCHFANGIGDPKYMPVISIDSLTKILVEALDGYNELNAAMNLVLFIDAVAHVLRIKLASRVLVRLGVYTLVHYVFGRFFCIYKFEMFVYPVSHIKTISTRSIPIT